VSTLKDYIEKHFGVSEEVFQNALALSPGSKGYIFGAISELLLKEYLEDSNFETIRIKEKPKGGNNAKSDEARGDFYIREKGSQEDKWLVVESKGLKSNSEFRGDKLSNKIKLYNFLKKIGLDDQKYKQSLFESGLKIYSRAKTIWETANPEKKFPPFRWNKEYPGAMACNIHGVWKNEKDLLSWIESQPEESFTEESYRSLNGPIIILETHEPDSRIGPITNIEQAAPLVDDFNIIAIDLFLRTGKHEFVFAASNDLSHSPGSPEHLYQNYTIDILIKGIKPDVKISPPWYKDVRQCILDTKPNSRLIDATQVDKRIAS